MTSTDELCREISAKSGGVCLLAFSRGKDSLAAWLHLRKFFGRIIPFHLSSVPGLKFVDDSLDAYETLFDTPIDRLVSPSLTRAVAKMIYQPLEDEVVIDAIPFPLFDEHKCADYIRTKHRVPSAWCAYGIGKNDSIGRRGWMVKMQGKNPKWRSFYPCWDWNRTQILDVIREQSIPLPADYHLAPRSLNGVPTEKHLERMETMMPEDFATIELHYPFIRATLARNEFRRRHAAATTAPKPPGSRKAKPKAGDSP